MANSLTLTKLLEGKRHLIVKVDFNVDTTAEFTTATISDPAGAGVGDPVPILGAAAVFTIEEIWHSLNNFDCQVLFDATTDTRVVALSSKTGDAHIDFRNFGGLKDPGGTGATGKLMITTIGCTANTSLGFIIFKLRKDYPAGKGNVS